jgi:hypothetical protein
VGLPLRELGAAAGHRRRDRGHRLLAQGLPPGAVAADPLLRRRIAQVEVNHRPRAAGRSKYGNLSRLARTWQDLLGVRWLQRRRLQYRIKDAT